MPIQVVVAGGGPAGASTAIAARLEGAPVRVIERVTGSRHKVCGEFISPGGRWCLEELQLWDEFAALGPHQITRCKLHLGKHCKEWRLPECAWGLSRLQLDTFLLDQAARHGAEVVRGEAFDHRRQDLAFSGLIVAYGRTNIHPPGDRIFGFKAHFEGPSNDAVELFFDASGYVGVSGIEAQRTNVCGLARESALRKYGFDFDAFVRRSSSMADRLAPLRRQMRWVAVGPISFSFPGNRSWPDQVYAAGDALMFVDPLTGSGILNALLTGRMAGLAAARGIASAEYLRACRSLLRTPFTVSSALRSLTWRTAFYGCTPYLPGQLLFRWTRASVQRASDLCAQNWKLSQ